MLYSYDEKFEYLNMDPIPKSFNPFSIRPLSGLDATYTAKLTRYSRV